MKVTDSFIIDASRKNVWDVFMDVEKLASCLPGCKDLIAKSETEYEANMEVKTAFMKVNFKANGFLKEAIEEEELNVEMVGKPMKLAGQFKTTMKVKLEELEPNQTKINYDMNLQMTGRLASLGDVLMRGTVKKSAGEFADNVQSLFTPVE